MVIEASQSHINNFYVIASYVALEVLQKDAYFQDLPANWQQIIHKIKEKLSAKEQSAQFEEKLTDIAPGEKNKASLPDAIKQLISALNCARQQAENPHTVSIPALDKLSCAYTPCATTAKIPLKKKGRDEELFEERSNKRTLFGPVN